MTHQRQRRVCNALWLNGRTALRRAKCWAALLGDRFS